jgi:DNA-binding CsgD family transcriptional regulator
LTPLYPCTLSQAEKEVLELSNKGKRPQEIADERGKKKRTIDNQLHMARKKVKRCKEALKNAE